MNVLSLCDGMSCGHIALDRAGIKVDKYFAAEIKDIGIKVTKANYPETIHIGDVNKVTYVDGVLHTQNGEFNVSIDLVMFGSPCQTFSIAMKKDLRIGLENLEKSGLFYQCYRILQEVKPRYFLMENVASMKDGDRNRITEIMGVQPVLLNSADVSPQIRKRYYWTNIPVAPIEKKDIKLQDILENGYSERDKARCLVVSGSRPLKTPVKIVHRYLTFGMWTVIFKSREHYEECIEYYQKHYKGLKAKDIPTDETSIFDGVRYLTQSELEKCQTVPEGYTKCLTRNEAADVLGDGWTVDVIAHILRGIKNEELARTVHMENNQRSITTGNRGTEGQDLSGNNEQRLMDNSIDRETLSGDVKMSDWRTWNIGDKVTYTWNEFDGKGSIEGEVKEKYADHLIIAADGMALWCDDSFAHMFRHE